jgi:hypothetical protein
MRHPCDALIPRIGENRIINRVDRCDEPSTLRVGVLYYCDKHRPEIEELKEVSE